MANRSVYEPFRELDRFLGGSLRQVPASPGMPLDLYRKDDEFVAQIDLPGVEPESIDIDIEDRTLTVRAERPATKSDGQTWLVHERTAGTFARQLTLGYGVALDRVDASYSDGVLTLTIPVAEEAKPRKISVSHTGKSRTIEHDQGDSSGDEATSEQN